MSYKCYAYHTSVFINDEEEGLKCDFKRWLENLVPPESERYQHNLTGEGNTPAHLKRSLMGREVVIGITKGKLDFGPGSSFFYGEFDNQKPKKVLVKITGE